LKKTLSQACHGANVLLQALQSQTLVVWSPTCEALIGSINGDKPLGLDIRIAVLTLSICFQEIKGGKD
jgi:hypothetical protein